MPSLSRAIGKLRRRHDTARDTEGPSPPSTSAEVSLLQNAELKVSRTPELSTSTTEQSRSSANSQIAQDVAESAIEPSEVSAALLATTDAEPPAQISASVANPAFEVALKELSKDLEPAERRAFFDAYQHITPEQTLMTIKALDEQDSETIARRGARSLEPTIRILNQFMAGVSIGIQQSPEISSLIVGGVRLIIDLVAKFVDFYNRLSEMICEIGDYLKPLALYSENAKVDSSLQDALIATYRQLLKFFRQARLVFVTNDGTIRKLGTFRTFFRVQWQPFEDSFGIIKSEFEQALKIVDISAQAQQLSLLTTLSERVETEVSRAHQERARVQLKEERDERLKFLEWISDERHEADFDRIIKQRHPGTGRWLVKTGKFQSWLRETSSSLLWCYGNPGAGKSVLASVALDHLSKYEFNDPTTCVIFAYYNYRRPERDNPASLIGSLIKQLCTKKKVLPQNLRTFFQNTFSNAKRPTFEDMEPLLYELLESYARIFIIIDGLDECEAPSMDKDKSKYIPGYRARYREEILDFITQLTQRESIFANILVTSRRERDIQIAFDRCPTIELDAKEVNSDIKIFLEDEIEKRIQKRSLQLQDPNLRETILDILGTRAQGMFLWAKLQLDWICDQDGDDDIRDALSDLPRDLYETYDHILNRIDHQTPRLQVLGRNALLWVLCTERPLTMPELQEALALGPGIMSVKELKLKLRDANVILNSAGNLLMVESTYPFYVRPIHASVTEYLTGHRSDQVDSTIAKYFIDLEAANCQLATSCMDYLQLDIFATGPCTNFTEFSARYLEDTSAQLWAYACFFFDKHIRSSQSFTYEIEKQLDKVLGNNNSFFAAVLQGRHSQGLLHTASSRFVKSKYPTNAATLVYSTSIYDILSIHRPSSRWLNVSPPKYALHHAISERLDRAVPRLVELTPDINEKDEDGVTPLYRAAIENDSLSITKYLLEHGAKVDLPSGDNGPALLAACSREGVSMLELLLKYNADVNVQGGQYNTVLQYACTIRRLDVVRTLLDNNADVNLEGGRFGTALKAACFHGYPPVVKLLLEAKADVNQAGGPYDTALMTASYFGYTSIVELLLEYSADINLRSNTYGTPLDVATYNGLADVVKLLLERGAIRTRKLHQEARENESPLSSVPAAKGLLETAPVHYQHHVNGTLSHNEVQISPRPIRYAIWKKSPLLLGKSLDSGLEATPQALEMATANCWYEGCLILIGRGVGITPEAQINVCRRDFTNSLGIAHLILENWRQPTVKALEEAAKWGWYDRCRILLGRGVQITEKALINACETSCMSDYVVWLLLRRGARVTGTALRSAWEAEMWAPRRYMLMKDYYKRGKIWDLSPSN